MYDNLSEPLRSAAILAHENLHRLWTEDVGTPGYSKKAWQELEKAIDGVVHALKVESDRDRFVAMLKREGVEFQRKRVEPTPGTHIFVHVPRGVDDCEGVEIAFWFDSSGALKRVFFDD